ncbi:MAG: Nif3-like dinuclear metal center hexameric protein [Saprospiraceae bacterium]
MPVAIREVTDYLETIAPLHLQESYDNAGLITGSPDWEVTGVLTSLDCLETTVDEAVERGCNLILAHHPIVFRGLKRINGSNYVERTIIKAIKNDVAIYAIHTNLDNVLRRGVNERIARRLGLEEVRVLAQKDAADPNVGAGAVGNLPADMSESELLEHVSERMGAQGVRHTALLNRPVRRVAVAGGSGSFLLPAAKRAGADAFVTADYKYHEFFDADGEILIIDIGHFESEQFTVGLLQEIIQEKYTTFAVLSTDRSTNPVYYPGKPRT